MTRPHTEADCGVSLWTSGFIFFERGSVPSSSFVAEKCYGLPCAILVGCLRLKSMKILWGSRRLYAAILVMHDMISVICYQFALPNIHDVLHFDIYMIGVEKSGRNAEGDSWWETWQEVLHQDEWR